MSSDNLIENNILHHIATPLQTNEGTGSVFAYNYTFDDYYSAAGNRPAPISMRPAPT